MGGRVPDQGPMNIAQVIHVERSVTPIIFRDFSKVDCAFFIENYKQTCTNPVFTSLILRYSTIRQEC